MIANQPGDRTNQVRVTNPVLVPPRDRATPATAPPAVLPWQRPRPDPKRPPQPSERAVILPPVTAARPPRQLSAVAALALPVAVTLTSAAAALAAGQPLAAVTAVAVALSAVPALIVSRTNRAPGTRPNAQLGRNPRVQP